MQQTTEKKRAMTLELKYQILMSALIKIAKSTCHEAQCWPLTDTAKLALKEVGCDVAN